MYTHTYMFNILTDIICDVLFIFRRILILDQQGNILNSLLIAFIM